MRTIKFTLIVGFVATTSHFYEVVSYFEGSCKSSYPYLPSKVLKKRRLMHYDVKTSGARIRTHDLWIRKRVCYPRHHSAPQVVG